MLYTQQRADRIMRSVHTPLDPPVHTVIMRAPLLQVPVFFVKVQKQKNSMLYTYHAVTCLYLQLPENAKFLVSYLLSKR